MIRSRKGQMGLLGEDLITYIVVALAIGAILAITVKAFYDHEERYEQLDAYRMALAYAEKAAYDLSWENDGDRRIRVLDAEKLASGYSCTTLSSLCVKTEETEYTLCGICDSMPSAGKERIVISLPVSVREDEKTFLSGTMDAVIESD